MGKNIVLTKGEIGTKGKKVMGKEMRYGKRPLKTIKPNIKKVKKMTIK